MFTSKRRGFPNLLISFITDNQSARIGFIVFTHEASRIDMISSLGEKQMMRFMRALHRLVIFGGSWEIACFCASVMIGPISTHLSFASVFSSSSTAASSREATAEWSEKKTGLVALICFPTDRNVLYVHMNRGGQMLVEVAI